jgi:hypothetical protein
VLSELSILKYAAYLIIGGVLLTGLSMVCGFSTLGADPEKPTPISLFPVPAEAPQSGPELFPTWWSRPPRPDIVFPCENAGECAICHEANAYMDLNHAFACVECHGGNSRSKSKDEAHRDLIRDPGDLRAVEKTCGKCHAEEVRRVSQSAMALAPRMINHTRFAFGSQKTPYPAYATAPCDKIKQVPHPAESSSLGDDLLRRSCLRCHLYTSGSKRSGEHRGQGCSACHVAYSNTGDGKPAFHGLVRDVGPTACLKCHNANHVGADYVGLFEKDSERGFRSPVMGGRQALQIYGSEQHRLTPDVHFRAGMTCTDCHLLTEIHGTGEAPRSAMSEVRISCESCHIRRDHPAMVGNEGGSMVLRTGDTRVAPRRNPDSIPHKVDLHRLKVKCSACHAAWSFQDYGFHLMLEERADYWKWARNAAQNDPQVQELLLRNVGTEVELIPPRREPVPAQPREEWELPSARDWLSGESRPGAWFRGFTTRRWSQPPLGLDHRGKVSVMRPMYQYVISHVDAAENLVVDRHVPVTGNGFAALIFNPYAPHTITRNARMCHECHGNPKALGLGEGTMGIEKPGFHSLWQPEAKVPGQSFLWDALVDDKANPLQRSSHPGAGPLDAGTLHRLLYPSDRHRGLWYLYLSGGMASDVGAERD